MTQVMPQRLEAIRQFADHPSLKGLNRNAIYCIDRTKFLFVDYCFADQIWLIGLSYTNMGDPYRVLARIEFRLDDRNDSFDVDLESAVRLLRYCKQQRVPLAVSSELAADKYFQRELDDE